MRVLSIGYGRHLWQDNADRRRLEACADATESLHSIIFTKQVSGLKAKQISEKFQLHPTNSQSKLTMIFDAVRIGGRLIEEKNIEVISCQDVFETGLVGVLLKRKYPHVTLQVQEHGDVLASPHWRKEKTSNLFRHRLAFFVMKHADIIRVVSKRTEEYLRAHLDSKKIIKRLPVVVDVESFKVTDKTYAFDDDNFTFLTAARFVPQKNFSLMLNAFAQVYESVPHVRLKIFGDGPDKQEILKQIEALGIEDAVHLQGWTDDLANEMQKANAYLLTSNYEGWGRVLIEAMLLHLPIVTTDVGCANEVVLHKEHGLIVPVDNLEQLVSAMTQMVIDTKLYESIRQRLQLVDVNSLPGTDIDTYAKAWIETMRK